MAEDLSGVTVRVKTTVRKFNGDEAYDPNAAPVEVIEREEDVPLSSLPEATQRALLEKRT